MSDQDNMKEFPRGEYKNFAEIKSPEERVGQFVMEVRDALHEGRELKDLRNYKLEIPGYRDREKGSKALKTLLAAAVADQDNTGDNLGAVAGSLVAQVFRGQESMEPSSFSFRVGDVLNREGKIAADDKVLSVWKPLLAAGTLSLVLAACGPQGGFAQGSGGSPTPEGTDAPTSEATDNPEPTVVPTEMAPTEVKQDLIDYDKLVEGVEPVAGQCGPEAVKDPNNAIVFQVEMGGDLVKQVPLELLATEVKYMNEHKGELLNKLPLFRSASTSFPRDGATAISANPGAMEFICRYSLEGNQTRVEGIGAVIKVENDLGEEELAIIHVNVAGLVFSGGDERYQALDAGSLAVFNGYATEFWFYVAPDGTSLAPLREYNIDYAAEIFESLDEAELAARREFASSRNLTTDELVLQMFVMGGFWN